jgi:recombination protein RecR
LKRPESDLQDFAAALENLKKEVVFCSICHNMAEKDPCSICADINRDHSIICVVEEPLDAQALDQTGEFKGVYHILGGVLSPLEGIGPENLTIESLMSRLSGGNIQEVILATNPSLEGETTALHLLSKIRPLGIKVTRLARGLPIGGDLEYADEITIMRALEGRSEYKI